MTGTFFEVRTRIQLYTFKTLDVGREGKSRIFTKLEPMEVHLKKDKKIFFKGTNEEPLL